MSKSRKFGRYLGALLGAIWLYVSLAARAAQPSPAPAESDGMPIPRAAPSEGLNRAEQKILQAGTPAFPLLTNDCVVFIGGTMTVGDARNAFSETLLTRRYPGYKLRFRNLGWAGDTVFRQERPLNFPSLIQSLKEQRATVVFVNFGLMESIQRKDGLIEFIQAYKRLLDDLNEVTPRIVLLSPFRHEPQRPPIQDVAEKNKNLEAYVRAIRELAEQRRLFFVDLFPLQNRTPQPDDAAPLTLNGIHPTAYGYWRAAYEIERSLGLTQTDWAVEIDARQRNYQAKGTTLTDVQISTSTVAFHSLDEMLPGPVFQKKEGNLSIWKSRILKVSGLLPGRYVLRIDGVPRYEQSERFWDRGWVLTHYPELDQTKRLRETIAQKNIDFFNLWRPQNWAFLSGDLISQPSSHQHDNFGARWFPGEMERFRPLLTRTEAEIDKLAKPAVHFYELKRVE